MQTEFWKDTEEFMQAILSFSVNLGISKAKQGIYVFLFEVMYGLALAYFHPGLVLFLNYNIV